MVKPDVVNQVNVLEDGVRGDPQPNVIKVNIGNECTLNVSIRYVILCLHGFVCKLPN